MAYADGPIEPPCAGLNSDAAHEDLYRMGIVYSTGLGVAANIVEAHKWFNLAASKGNEDAKIGRQEMADQMSKDELAEALKAAREWLRTMN